MKISSKISAFLGTTAIVSACIFAGSVALADDHMIDVAEQDLFTAIEELSNETGVSIALNQRFVANRNSRAVVGPMSVRQALVAMLNDPNLQVNSLADGSLAVVPVSALNFVSQNAVDGTDLGELVLGAPTSDRATVGAPPEPFAGGQVATGSRLGVLGNRDVFDTPFNTTSYTSEQIERRQSRDLEDVLLSSPSVSNNRNRTESGDNFTFRGFTQPQNTTQIDGFSGIVPFRRTSITGIDRVELLFGPSALLQGAPLLSADGGVINLVPKTAGPEPLTELSFGVTDFGSGSQGLDLSRRFGQQQEFGFRLNADLIGGDTTFDRGQADETSVLANFDYIGGPFRARLNFGYHEDDIRQQSPFIGISPGFTLPDAPDGSVGLALDSDFDRTETLFATARLEYDISDNVTLFGGLAYSDYEQQFYGGFFNIINSAGDSDGFGGSAFNFQEQVETTNIELGARGEFTLGQTRNEWSIVGTRINQKLEESGADQGVPFISNIFDPVTTPIPITVPDNFFNETERTQTGVTFANTTYLLEDRLQLTYGARYQRIEFEGTFSDGYDEDAWSPALAVLYKPTDQLSLYANYIEGLSQGGSAPLTAANAGEALDPITTEQFEIGAKYDFGNLGASVSLFQIERPSEFTDPVTNVFGQFGEQRNRGVEFNVFGEVAEGVRLLGGLTFLDAKLTSTGDPATEGRDALGVSDLAAVLEIDADIRSVPGLSAYGRVRYESAAPTDFDTQEVPEWFRFDIGANYDFKAGGTDMTARLAINNVFDENYFIASPENSVSIGEPRTISFSISAKF